MPPVLADALVEVPWPETWVASECGAYRGVRARRVDDGAEGLYQVSQGAFVVTPVLARAGVREKAADAVLEALYADHAATPSYVLEAVAHSSILLLAEEDACGAAEVRKTLARFRVPLADPRPMRSFRPLLVMPMRTRVARRVA